jgi:hypothetical protein
MKKIILGMMAIALMSTTAIAANDGGKKKARKKAKTECKKEANCDPKNCDPKDCDPKCCDYKSCSKDEKCTTAPACKGS